MAEFDIEDFLGEGAGPSKKSKNEASPALFESSAKRSSLDLNDYLGATPQNSSLPDDSGSLKGGQHASFVEFEPNRAIQTDKTKSLFTKVVGITALLLILAGGAMVGLPVLLAVFLALFMTVIFALAIVSLERKRSGADIKVMLGQGATDMQRSLAESLLVSLEGKQKVDRSIAVLLKRSASPTSANTWALRAFLGSVLLAAIIGFLANSRFIAPFDVIGSAIANRLIPVSGFSSAASDFLGQILLFVVTLLLVPVFFKMMKAGRSFNSAVAGAAGESTCEPINTEILSTLSRISMGAEANVEWKRTADVMDSRGLMQTAQAYQICVETGGPLAEVLGNVAHSIRDVHEILNEVAAKSAQARIAAGMLFMMTPTVGMFIFRSNPEYIGQLFTDPIGWGLLVIASLALMLGGFFMKKLTAFDG